MALGFGFWPNEAGHDHLVPVEREHHLLGIVQPIARVPGPLDCLITIEEIEGLTHTSGAHESFPVKLVLVAEGWH